MAGKWNYKTKKYDPYEFKKNWKVKLVSLNMDEIVNCVQCGKKMRYGDGYTSKEIHTDIGFGYHVCEKCYLKEREREKCSKQ